MTTPTASRPPQMSPVFVFGADHSGTTILYRMLAYHRELAWLSQFSMRRGEIPGRSRRPIVDRLDPLLQRLPHPWRKEDSRLRRVFVPHPGEEAAVWRFLLEDETTNAARVRAHLTSFSRRHGGRRLIAKRPAFHRHLELLSAAFPRACFVHVVRDGRPVALSLRSKEVAMRARRGREPVAPDAALEGAARYWVEVLERARKTTTGIDLLEVRYEDLCGDVHALIRTILAHAGLASEGFPFRRCPRALESRNSYWVEAASSRELAEISRIESDLLRRYGYPVDSRRLEGALLER
jgi:Sulfotransferase family